MSTAEFFLYLLPPALILTGVMAYLDFRIKRAQAIHKEKIRHQLHLERDRENAERESRLVQDTIRQTIQALQNNDGSFDFQRFNSGAVLSTDTLLMPTDHLTSFSVMEGKPVVKLIKTPFKSEASGTVVFENDEEDDEFEGEEMEAYEDSETDSVVHEDECIVQVNEPLLGSHGQRL